MTDTQHLTTARELADAADGDEGPLATRRGAPATYDASRALDYAELVELWHHQQNVAMHKERLYLPSSLAILVGTILGWKDLSGTVVAAGAIASIGLCWYLVRILEDFAQRQDRCYRRMHALRSDVLRVMFDQSAVHFGAESEFVAPPTVQRALRRPFFATLIGVWLTLLLVKLGLFV